MTDSAQKQIAATVRLYHHTSPEAALLIIQEQRMRFAALVDGPFAFFSTDLLGLASGVGRRASAAAARLPSRSRCRPGW